MKAHPARGAKFGAISAVFFAILTPVNNLIGNEVVDWQKIAIGTAFAFLFFGLIGTFTDKVGNEVGDA